MHQIRRQSCISILVIHSQTLDKGQTLAVFLDNGGLQVPKNSLQMKHVFEGICDGLRTFNSHARAGLGLLRLNEEFAMNFCSCSSVAWTWRNASETHSPQWAS